jgi:hypothetical protein
MSLLPNNTYANPANSFYGEAGQGAANSLQSPAEIVPDAALGDAILNVNSAPGNTEATVTVLGGVAGIGSIQVGGGGYTYNLTANTAPLPGGSLQLIQAPLQGGQTPVLQYTPTTGNLILGDSLPGGSVQIDNKLLVAGAPANLNAVQIQSTSGTTANIFNTVASAGGLLVGSSAACPSTLAVADTAGVGTQFVAVGNGVGTTNLRLQGGSSGLNVPIVATSAADAGTLCLGSSATNPQGLFVANTGGANNGYVDITRGTSLGVALRLQGYGASSAGAIISTNAAVGANQRLNIQSATNNANPNIVIQDTATTMYTPMSAGVGYSNISSQSLASGGDIGNTIYALTNPTAIGVYNIMVRVGDNVAININGQVNSIGFWNGTIWTAGGTNISPPVGSGNVVISFGTNASRTTLYLQNTGSAQLQQVVVYMIPQLLGLGGVIT